MVNSHGSLERTTLGCGQAVRRRTLDQEIEGSNPSAPANLTPTPQQVVVAAHLGADVVSFA